nr:FapA family protein [Saccharibacillus sp. JS10]
MKFNEDIDTLSETTHTTPCNGLIEIRENRFIVTDPQDEGDFAVLIPTFPLRLWLNGVEMRNPFPVRASDRIEWERAEEPLYEIKVSPDRMQAFLTVFSEIRYAWKLQDCAVAERLAPTSVHDLENPVHRLEIAEIMAEIGKQGIRKNLDVSAIAGILQEATGQAAQFAFGEEALPGVDATIDLLFEQKIENAFEEVGGALDYRNHLRIPSVQPGDILAYAHPSQPGTPGFDVFGDVIEPPPVREIDLRARQHVEEREGGIFVATKAGRPCLAEGTVCYLDISDAYFVAGDVDLKTGNIVFSGDVTIQGHVTDNMIVESLGNVYISGGVYNSTITAAGSIIVLGSVIGSRLYSGSFGLSFNRLYHLSQKLKNDLGVLLQASRTLYTEVGKRGQSAKFGQVALLLLKSKFKEIQPDIRELLQVMITVQRSTGGASNEFADALNLMLSPTQMIESLTEDLLLNLQDHLDREHTFVDDMQKSDAQIELSRCQTSTIKSNGDIVIHKEGILQSDLYATGSITFAHPSSVCRGSCLEAEDRINAKTVGSAGGAPCILRAKRTIYVSQMFDGKISAGGLHREILAPVRDCTFGYMEDNATPLPN